MNILDVFTGLYRKLHNYPGVPYWVLTPFRRMTRNLANRLLPKYLDDIHIHRERQVCGDGRIIVSLTSFPARIDTVWQVIECFLNQSMMPKKIILWLSRQQFRDNTTVPKKLQDMENGIFQIRMVDGDIRSHKKYFYAARENPDALIFLADDDIYYPTTILEQSYKTYLKNSNYIVGNYGYEIQYNDDGTRKPYKEWKHVYGLRKGNNLFFGSGGGTLIQPSKMHEDLLDIEKATNMAPFADDIWLNAMAQLSGIKIILLGLNGILPIYSESEKLASTNNGQSQNEIQLCNIENFYGRCFDRK